MRWLPNRVGRFTNITCIQTLAGFQKILGRKNFSPQELRVVFQDNREDCEALANLLYDADDGEPVVLGDQIEALEVEHLVLLLFLAVEPVATGYCGGATSRPTITR